jgi:Transcriptional regulator
MDMKQLRYVVAIANTGTFREASEQLFVSQPSLSVSIKDLENNLGFLIFERTSSGVLLTPQGERFYEQAQEILRDFENFESRYTEKEEIKNFSVASQHYDFLAPAGVDFVKKNQEIKNFRIFESTTFNILKEVADGHSEIGIAYLNKSNRTGIMRMLNKLELEEIELLRFDTHIYVSKSHPLALKESVSRCDLEKLSRVRFSQESDQYLYYSEDLVETFEGSLIYNVTDRATLNGILNRTTSYATGSGYIDQDSVKDIVALPLEVPEENALILFKQKKRNLSKLAQSFKASLEEYFKNNKI